MSRKFLNHVDAKICFNKKLHDWDGFGFNYVQLCQTVDYEAFPQDYGGFSSLGEDGRRKILEMVFGKDGLRPSILKMFFDPFHQEEHCVNAPGPGNLDQNNYNHTKTTEWVRYFAREGLRLTRKDGRDLQILACLYGMPGWMTKQKQLRARDINTCFTQELAKYMAAYVDFLKKRDGLPVRYISIHNEGEDYTRWPEDGYRPEDGDYNAHWSPEYVCEFIKALSEVLTANGIYDVKPTPGETSNWLRFFNYGYADAIADDDEALNAIGLITSHGFTGHLIGEKNYADFRSAGTDLIRAKRPELHSWVTSTSWSNMDARFVYQLREHIYSAKNNAVIPWAGIQRPSHWIFSDPNPGCAILVDDGGSYTLRDGYYYYKQVCRIGQAGMYVARTSCTDSFTCAMAFACNGTKNPNAFALINSSQAEKSFSVTITGGKAAEMTVSRTCDSEKHAAQEDIRVRNGGFMYLAPPNSVTTFIEK